MLNSHPCGEQKSSRELIIRGEMTFSHPAIMETVLLSLVSSFDLGTAPPPQAKHETHTQPFESRET